MFERIVNILLESCSSILRSPLKNQTMTQHVLLLKRFFFERYLQELNNNGNERVNILGIFISTSYIS